MTHRNRALLDLCHEAPCFLLPGQHECSGPSEPAHSDMIRHGRGEGHKSHDCFAVPGCHNAHLAFTRTNLGKDGYHAAWTEAMERWILYLWVSEKIQITAHPRAGKETSMEAPLCRICSHKHWAREPHQGLNPTKEEMRRAQPATVKPAGTAGPAKPCPASATAATKPAGNTSAKPKSPAGSTRKGTKRGRKMIKRPPQTDIERNVSTSSVIEYGGGRNAGKTDAQREGRRVLKGEKPTRTASTERTDPLTPPAKAENQTKADKVTPGKRKTAPKKKRKAKKKDKL